MNQQCQMDGCKRWSSRTIDVWVLCEKHAQQYELRFAEALEAQKQKRLANARLIAAAPEMYEAIRTFIQKTERAKGVKFSASMMGGFIAMKKALAKAEGG